MSGGSLRSKGDIPMQACEAYETLNTQQQTGNRTTTVDESADYEVVEGLHGEQENDSDVYENITQL